MFTKIFYFITLISLAIGSLLVHSVPFCEGSFGFSISSIIRAKGSSAGRRLSLDVETLSRFMSKKESESLKQNFEQGLQFAEENLQYVILRSNGAVLFHGSKSGSLIAFTANETLGGLRSSGELMQSGKVSFVGEQGIGTKPKSGYDSEGVNVKHLSTVKITDLDIAVQYSTKSARTIFTDPLSKAQWDLMVWRDFERDPQTAEQAKLKMAQAEQRIAQWNQFTEQDQNLILENFPVLYGINPRLSRKVIKLPPGAAFGKQGAGTEIGLEGGADFGEITSIFVPKNKVKLVKSIIKFQNSDGDIIISPIEPIYTAFRALHPNGWDNLHLPEL